MAQTTEKSFESYVEELLLTRSGWQAGDRAEWDKGYALFPAQVCAFLAATQSKRWAEMQRLHGAGLEALLTKAVVNELDTKGTLHVLRHGFKFYGKTFQLAYFKPSHGLSPDVLALYEKNCLTVTRQVPCHPNSNDTIDLVFAVNGLPMATCELKNPGAMNSGQNWRHAVQQYQTDRDPRAPLFQFKKRALVHFAADPDEVYMATQLKKEHTFFLPFNRGSHPGEVKCGAGNPQHPSGYRTGYFWEEVLQRDSFLDILGGFMFVEKEEKKVDDGQGGKRIVIEEKLVFPRYHQLDAVRKLVTAARAEGTGNNYLIQHSAGSGKTNSISWLSHRLASLHNSTDQKVFDCVLVITDRQVLDQQLQDAVYQIEHAQGVIKCIDQDSRQLAESLIDGTRIVITTLQKFPFVLKGLLYAAGAESQEGRLSGSFNEALYFNQIPDNEALNLKMIDEMGGPTTYPHYPMGWAMAGNTPFKMYKQNTHAGGNTDPFIIHWPRGIKDKGAIRTQYHHLIDVTPMVLEAIGLQQPKTINGVAQRTFDGGSMLYSLNDATAKSRHETQYFEMLGHRAIYHNGWKAIAWHERGTDWEKDKWELYKVDEDFNETNDLAAKQPDKLREMVERW